MFRQPCGRQGHFLDAQGGSKGLSGHQLPVFAGELSHPWTSSTPREGSLLTLLASKAPVLSQQQGQPLPAVLTALTAPKGCQIGSTNHSAQFQLLH